MHRHSKARQRRGWTLIEMLIYISIATFLLPLAFVTLAKAMRAAERVREQSQSAGSLQRLAAQFRDDVHDATAATLAQGGKELVLTISAEHSVRYKATAAAFQRTVKAGDVTQASDTFLLPNLLPGGLEVRSDPAVAALLLRVAPDDQPQAGAGGRTFAVTASIARNHRFEKHE
jgi:type II secretory pathway pseudopilin PulG